MAKARNKSKSKNNVEKIENLDWAAAIDDSARLIAETRRDFDELDGTAINRWVNKHIPLVLNEIKGLRKDDKIEAVIAAIAAHNEAVKSFRDNMNENKDDDVVDDEEDEEDDDDESENNNNSDDDVVDDEEEEEDVDMDLGNQGPRTRSARARARAARSAGGTKGKGRSYSSNSNSNSGSGKKKKGKKDKKEISKDYSPTLDSPDFDDFEDFEEEEEKNDKTKGGNKNKSKGKGKGKDKNKGNKKSKNGKKNKGRGGNNNNKKRKGKSGVNGSNDRMDDGFVYDEEVDEKLNGNRPRGRGSRRKGGGDEIFIDGEKVRGFRKGIDDLKGKYKGKRKEVMFCVNCILACIAWHDSLFLFLSFFDFSFLFYLLFIFYGR